MTRLGIDPGLATMGWGAISYDGVKPKILDYGALITPPDMRWRSCSSART